MTEEEIEAAELFETIMISPYLVEISAALDRAKTQATYAYEFVPNSYTYHAYVSCLHAHKIVAEVAARLERMAAA